MILSVCLNPCRDHYISYIDGKKFNKITNYVVYYAGKGLNVAHSATVLGADAAVFLLSPDTMSNGLGEYLIKNSLKHGILTYAGQERNNIKLIAPTGTLTEYNSNGNVVPEDLNIEAAFEAFFDKFSDKNGNNVLTLSGSVPNGVNPCLYKNLAEIAGKNAKIVADCYGGQLVNLLSAKPLLVKPNLTELEEWAGKTLSTDSEIVLACKKMQAAGAQNIIVSMGESGAVLVLKEDKVYKALPPKGINVVNTVGAGDAMVAAAAVSIHSGDSLHKTFLYAVTAASIKVTQTTPYLNTAFEAAQNIELSEINI